MIAGRRLRRSLFAWVAIATVSSAGLAAWQRNTTPPVPTFRSASTVVTVNASVKRGNRPVTGLTEADFTVTDNGIAQHVEHVSFEEVPIDATVVIDVSGSTSSIVDDIRDDTNKFLGLLRPIDRARVLVIDTGIYELLPLQNAGNRVTLPPTPMFGGLSSVRDAILAGLINHPDPERRRIVVALTDADDTKSITEAGAIYEVARRSDTVLHLIIVRPPANAPMMSTLSLNQPLAFLRPTQSPGERKTLFDAAVVTGGAVHGATANDVIVHKVNAVGTFKKVIDEFRQSYVLQYQPANVPATGWHDIAVSVKGVDEKGVRARKGYFAGAQ